MTENDYTIKPLPNLPNVTGVNPSKGGEDRNNRQSSKKRPAPNPPSVEEIITDLNEDEKTVTAEDSEYRPHIDYRA